MAEYYRRELAVFDLPALEKVGDDCHDLGPLGKHCFPVMRSGLKRHTLTLIVSGPDSEEIRQKVLQCVQSGVVDAALASVALAFSPVGLPTLGGVIALAATAFMTCLGDKNGGVSADLPHTEAWL